MSLLSDSSVEDEEVAAEEESDSGLEPQQTQYAMARSRLPAPSSSEEEAESETETESDSDSDSHVKPLAAKPILEETQKKPILEETQTKPVEESKILLSFRRASHGTKKPDADVVTPMQKCPVEDTPSSYAKKSKKTTTESSNLFQRPDADVVAPTLKCPVEDTPSYAMKSKKTAAESQTSGRKSNLFQRVWSEEDEIIILRGMIDFNLKFNSDPIAESNMFHSFIKEDLLVDGSRTQLADKMRRLKKKFEKKRRNGKKMNFSNPHERSVFDLSKIIWGSKEKQIVVNGGVVNGKEGGEVEKKRRRLDLNYQGPTTMEERMLMDGGDMFESGQGLEGEKEWKKLRAGELQNHLKHLEIRVAQTKLVLGAMMKHS
ncbi:putative transcription factor [Salvia divinorum]|uniref:Transcription factor n=1 Tax=Salvia divinorum TaxID=28513 RepID=A0ABD1FHD1_SALDI